MKLVILERDEYGSQFRATFVAQGAFECEIKGDFCHSYDEPNSSTWEVDHLKNFGSVNGLQHYPVDEILTLLGNGDMDIGTEILDSMLKPFLDDDYSDWSEWLEAEAQAASTQEQMQANHYRSQAGF